MSRRNRAPSRTARGRLMFPKPAPRRDTPAEMQAFYCAPLATIQSDAERLLEEIIQHGHVAGQTDPGDWGQPLLVVEFPMSIYTLRKLFAFAIARADLEPEPDTGVDDFPEGILMEDMEEDDPAEEDNLRRPRVGGR